LRAPRPAPVQIVLLLATAVLASLATACARIPSRELAQPPAREVESRSDPVQKPLPNVPFDSTHPVECPNVEAESREEGARGIHTFPMIIQLAGVITDIPEFHDCQRLMTSSGDEFGPLVGLWASEKLVQFSGEHFQAAQGVPVVEAYNFNLGIPYAELGIEPGYNCLYVRKRADWSASMISRGSSNSCRATITDAEWSSGTALSVVRIAHPADVGLIPPVARWDWDPRRRLHYIGVRCGDAWCEIGRSGFQSSTRYSGGPTQRIKGWYDEQWLAVPGPGFRLVPRPRAVIVPVEGVDTMTMPYFICPGSCAARTVGWKHVANARFTDVGHPTYASKLNLHPGRESEIYMRARIGQQGRLVWESRIVSGTTIAYKKVVRVDHGTMYVPGTARWAWRENDETAWVRCAVGCCSVTDEDF
jgi:hypothetical protein